MTLTYTPQWAEPADIDALTHHIIARTGYGLHGEVTKGDYDGTATIFYTDRWGEQDTQDANTLADLLDTYTQLDHNGYDIDLIELPDNIAAELHPATAAA